MAAIFQKTNGKEFGADTYKDDTYYWQLWHHNWDDYEIELFKSRLDLQGKTVLEVGCGDGRVAYSLAPFCDQISGIDLDEKLILSAKMRLKDSGLTNVGFEVMDAQNLQISNGTIDIALYPWVLHMVNDRKVTMKEAHRILKPGGSAAIIGIHSDSDYDEIIAPFVVNPPNVSPVSFYEEPIRESFKHVEVFERECFPYVFQSIEIAHDAFVYTLKFHYGAELNTDQKSRLMNMLKKYEHREKVVFNFYASLYLATK